MGEIPRADPASSPRISSGGEATRERPVFEASSAAPPWKVEVIPTVGVHREFEVAAGRPRATFEVRAEFEGEGLDAFEPVGKVGRVESWATPDLELAKAVAIAAVDELRAGREPVLVQLVGRFSRR